MMQWGADTWLKLASVLLTLGTLGIGGYIKLLLGRLAKQQGEIDALRDALAAAAKDAEERRGRSVGELRDRIAHLEAIIDHTPSKDDFHQLALTLASLNGDMRETSTKIESIESSVSRIENYLIDKSK